MKEEYCRLCMEDITRNMRVRDFLTQDQLLCTDCLAKLKRIDRHVVWEGISMHILYEYNDFLESMIFQFKEGHDVALADVFFYSDIKKLNDKYRHCAFVLLPSSEEKLKERGFLPMREMLRRAHVEIVEPFYKTSNYKQSLQSFKNRGEIRHVMRRKDDVILPKKRLVIVDDVCTSGSSIAWAYQLLSSHTYKIEVLVLSATHLFVENCDKKDLKKQMMFSILGHVRRKGKVK